jgi:hypothetical protein
MKINPCTRCDGPTLFGAGGETFCRYCNRPQSQTENAGYHVEANLSTELGQIISAFRQQGGPQALGAAKSWRAWLPYGTVLAVLTIVLLDLNGLIPPGVLPLALFAGVVALLLIGAY